MSQSERERILAALDQGCRPFAHSLVNVQAKDILALVDWIHELRAPPAEVNPPAPETTA